MFKFLLTSAQIFIFFSLFLPKTMLIHNLDWDYLAGQKCLWRLFSAFDLSILCKRSQIIQILYADVSKSCKIFGFWGKIPYKILHWP